MEQIRVFGVLHRAKGVEDVWTNHSRVVRGGAEPEVEVAVDVDRGVVPYALHYATEVPPEGGPLIP